MIKHLRFFMLNLLVLVSAAVMAQTRVVFSDGLPSDWTKLAQLQNKPMQENLAYSCKKTLLSQAQQ